MIWAQRLSYVGELGFDMKCFDLYKIFWEGKTLTYHIVVCMQWINDIFLQS